MIKIIFNDITEDKMDELEEIFINTLGVYTEIYEGTTKDCFRYVLEVEDNDTLLVDDEEYNLENVSVVFKRGGYMVEVTNNREVSMVEISANHVMSITIC